MGEILIRDVSRPPTRQWVPPIGAMGGPPAHELYRDLVLHAGLRLLRDTEANPCVAIRDGEHRHIFRVPSAELREALDRFRMRRNLRPVPEQELADFARVVQARASDPDLFVPTFDPGETDRAGARPDSRRDTESDPLPEREGAGWLGELDAILREADEVRGPAPSTEQVIVKAPSAWNEVVDHLGPSDPSTAPPLRPAVSGARMSAPAQEGLPRYLEVLRSLVQEGGWLGTTAELSTLVGETPGQVFACLRDYRSALADSDIVVAPVETKDGWRWLAVDRAHLRSVRS